jgi:hypothetical protein
MKLLTHLSIVVATIGSTGFVFGAETLSPTAAREFIAGKRFAFECFEGSRGAGRIYSDGSVEGSIQFRGNGEARYVRLPKGTLRVYGESYCASVTGVPYQPCFQVERRNSRSFRGSLLGVASLFCEFRRTSDEPHAATDSDLRHAGRPLPLTPQLATSDRR